MDYLFASNFQQKHNMSSTIDKQNFITYFINYNLTLNIYVRGLVKNN